MASTLLTQYFFIFFVTYGLLLLPGPLELTLPKVGGTLKDHSDILSISVYVYASLSQLLHGR